jgi:hypothetical protein
MPYRIFILLLICLQAVQVYSQDFLRYNTKWHLSTSFGGTTTLRPYFKGEVTDPLVEFDDRTFSWQWLSTSYFFKKHWGVALNIQWSYPQRAAKKVDQFNQLMQAQYENNYYVNTYAGNIYTFEPGFVGKITSGYLGVVYRKEWSRFFIYPKLAIGITSFFNNRGEVNLKQKNTNDVLGVSFRSEGGRDFFTCSASALAGYKLSKRIFLHIEPSGAFHNTGFSYTKKTTNLNTQESTTDVISYKRNMLSVSLTAGLTYVLK